MLTVACVLRTGGGYMAAHVRALREGVRTHLKGVPYKFTCMTDDPAAEADEILPLREGWPGWWSKMELFDGRLGKPVLYLDLDTAIVGDLAKLCLGHRFTLLQNFLRPQAYGTGLMAWNCDLSGLYRKFLFGPEEHMRRYHRPSLWGDQDFVRTNLPFRPGTWQAAHPGRVVSFKLDCISHGGVPPGASVVCFHGEPRPWELDGTQRGWFDK